MDTPWSVSPITCCFQSFTAKNKALISIYCVFVNMQSFLFGNYLGMRLGSHMCWVHSFLSNYQFQLPFYTPTSNRWDPSSLLLAIVSSFNFGHPDVVLLLHHGNLNFPMTTDFGHLLIYLVVIHISSFVKRPFKCFAFVIGFFLLSYIFWTKFFFIYIYNIFS